jgi:hypothetical protein
MSIIKVADLGISSGVATPAFRAYQNSVQSLGNTTQTVISYGVESYDTDNCYSTSTYRFTPNKAGKYLIGMSIRFDNVNSARTIGYIYKNSSPVAISEEWSDSGGGPDNHPQCTTIVEMNGSTDYVEARAYHDKGFAVNSGIVGEVTYFFGQRLIGV